MPGAFVTDKLCYSQVGRHFWGSISELATSR